MSAIDYNILLSKITTVDKCLDIKKLSAHLDLNHVRPSFMLQQRIQLGISNMAYMAYQIAYNNECHACNGAIYCSLPDSVRHKFLNTYNWNNSIVFMGQQISLVSHNLHVGWSKKKLSKISHNFFSHLALHLVTHNLNSHSLVLQ